MKVTLQAVSGSVTSRWLWLQRTMSTASPSTVALQPDSPARRVLAQAGPQRWPEVGQAIARGMHAAGADSYSIISGHVKHARIYDIACDERILRYVRDIIGDDIVCWGAHFFCKMPGDGKTVSWHQDASYWPLTPSKTVTCWLAIDTSDADNACMQFIPGSHIQGHLEYRTSDASEHNVLNQTVEDAERFGQPVDDALEAGEFSLHSDLLLHGSGVNTSNRRRGGLTLRYAAAEVRSLLNWQGEGIIVSGSDPSGHWGNPPRPDVD